MASVASFGKGLSLEEVRFGVRAESKEDVLERAARELARRTGLPARQLHAALFSRERVSATLLGQGVAIPHARMHGLERPHAVLWCLATPVSWDSDGSEFDAGIPTDAPSDSGEESVDILCLLLVPEFAAKPDAGAPPQKKRARPPNETERGHLGLLAEAAHRLSDPRLVTRLRALGEGGDEPESGRTTAALAAFSAAGVSKCAPPAVFAAAEGAPHAGSPAGYGGGRA